VDRRRFLGAGTASVLGVAAGAVVDVGPAHATDARAEPPLDLEAYLSRLDDGMRKLESFSLEERFGPSATRPADADLLVRRMTQALYFTGMVGELPVDVQIRPEVQERIAAVLPLMDEATDRTLSFLQGQSAAELQRVQQALRDGAVGREVIDRFDALAADSGVSERRREHTRKMFTELEWRLRTQPATTVVTAYTEKVQRLLESDLATEARTRELAARIGEKAFWQQAELTRRQRLVSRGGRTMGWGVLVFAGGALIVSAGTFEGVFIMTAGAVMMLVGLIILVVGAATPA
jgi:hypothetical protein